MDSQPSTNAAAPAPTPTGQPVGEDPGKTLAIVGIVLAFFFSLAGLVLSIIARSKSKAAGFNNSLATVGIWLNGVFLALGIIFIIIWMVFIGAIIGVASSSAHDVVQEGNQNAAAKKDFVKGETAEFGKFEVKVNSVQRNYTSSSEYSVPADGKEFVVVNLTVKNVSSDTEYISPYSFSLNNNGVATNSTYITGLGELLDSSKLSPGASATGNIPFEATKDATGLKLQFEGSGFVGTGTNIDYKQFTYTLAL